MKKKLIIAGLTATAFAAAIPAVASAGFMSEMDAADQVERVMSHRYGFDGYASCRSLGHKTFTCTLGGSKGDCFYDGRANVRKESAYRYRVTTMHVSKDCF